ncbi:hypothetical protein [Bacterioplanes sanyensis]|uniref:hypothetical protein n=1 Tax=Bacterioplanes sanyensis TaxID=1249553 RepID=UPI0012FDA54B|nr:hypothetical protein [Bacterioplanes sanyensis]
MIDWTGRIVRHDKYGAIAPIADTILDRLGVDSAQWISMAWILDESGTFLIDKYLHGL